MFVCIHSSCYLCVLEGMKLDKESSRVLQVCAVVTAIVCVCVFVCVCVYAHIV